MRTLTRALCALVTAASLLAGCGPALVLRAQHTSDEGAGQVWVSGCEGYAARFEGASLVRHDYPVGPEAQPCDHDFWWPQTRVVVRDGVPYLFTREGVVMAWQGSGWSRLATLATGAPPGTPIDDVHLLPDGRWMVYVHPGTLLFATHDDLLASRFTSEQIPLFARWMGVINGAVYAVVSSTEHGSSDARMFALRLDGPGRWTSWPLPAPGAIGVVRLARGEIAALTYRSLVLLERGGQTLSPSPRPLAGENNIFSNVFAVSGDRQLISAFVGQTRGLAEFTDEGFVFWAMPWHRGSATGAFLVDGTPRAVLWDGRVVAPVARTRVPDVAEIAGP